MNRKVFVSYAGEDKERFVLGFSKKLRERAVDAWVAEWEIAAGDSVVRRIFDEGLGRADAVIIVLSRYSVDKPWVRAELDVAKVREIEESTRLIPILIEECEVPMPLRATRWETIKDLSSYDTVLERVVMAINGMHDRPPLGNPPTYTTTQFAPIANLPQSASLILKLCYDILLERYPNFGETDEILRQTEVLGIPMQQAHEALDILDRRKLITGPTSTGEDIFAHTYSGLATYIGAYVPNYDAIMADVISQIVNYNNEQSDEIAELLGAKHLLILHILESLQARGLLELSEMNGPMMYVSDYSPELKYIL